MDLCTQDMLCWSKQVPHINKMWAQGITSANWIRVLLTFFHYFLLEKLLLDNSVKLLTMPHPGLT